MTPPFVSFIIPVYKVENYLDKCIKSILNQSCIDWEMILIDDGSPDNCGKICDKYSATDNRICVIHQQNQGVAVARNRGLDKAVGKWIWFVDSDDYIMPDALEHLYKGTKGSMCDTVFFNILNEWNNKIEHSANPKKNLATNLKKNEFLTQFFSYTNPTILFNRNLIEKYKIRFTQGIQVAEDLEFQYKYLIHCQNPINIDKALYVYNHHNDSAMHNIKTNTHNVVDCIRVCKNLQLYIENERLPEIQWLTIRIRLLLKSAIQSAEKLPSNDVINVQNNIKHILRDYNKIGYKHIADSTLKIAKFNLKFYFFALRIFYFLNNKHPKKENNEIINDYTCV